MVTPGRLELPAYGLGNRRSILLSYGVAGTCFRQTSAPFTRILPDRAPNRARILRLILPDGRLSPLQPFRRQEQRAFTQEKVMKRILNKGCMSALLCGAVMIATPSLAQLGGAVGGTVSGATRGVGGTANAGAGAMGRSGSATTGINGTVTTPSAAPATGAINRTTIAAENTANAGAGT